MNPYSHLVVASKLETLVNPESKPEYYWGAIAPDIRYPAAMRRRQTHLPTPQILAYLSGYPHLKSFLQGYLVHCFADEIELRQVFSQHFPFSMLKNRMSRRNLAVILELYYFENESISTALSSAHNEVLSELGLSETLSEKFSKSISQYALASSHESRLAGLFELLGLENDSRVESYLSAARSFQKNWLLKNILFVGIRIGKISEQIVTDVARLYNQCSL